MITSVYAKSIYDRLRTDKALGILKNIYKKKKKKKKKNNNNNNNKVRCDYGPFPGPKS